MQRKALADQVAVVMGASTGIGRLTAHELAKRGAKVVVSARAQESLDELVNEIRDFGGHAVAIAADTVDPEQVRAVADLAVNQLGGLDTWVQAAAVSVYAPLESTPAEEFKRVVD